MIYLKQLGIILGISCVGECLHAVISLPVPASVYGLVIMLILLMTGALNTQQVRPTATRLIELMPIMFVPPAIGLTQVWNRLSSAWVGFVVICLVSTLVVMAISGRVTQAVLRREGGAGADKGGEA